MHCSTTVGHTATYTCDEGYKLEPIESINRQCLETGVWSGVHPICTGILSIFLPLQLSIKHKTYCKQSL